MFPLRSDGFVLEDPSFLDENKFLEDLLVDFDSAEGNQLISDEGLEKRQKAVEKNKDEPKSSNASKKIMHRDIERQRRQEMAALYASLRSLLPTEYIKGRRSTSDLVDMAVNYIKHMQKKIKEMQTKKDKLKNVQSIAIHAEETKSSNDESCNFVKINRCRNGIEILITSSLNEQGFFLSKVLMDLVGRGFNVISCISTRSVDDSFLHVIQIEVKDLAKFNLSELQERLANVIKFASGV